jgi:hypothetical protein
MASSASLRQRRRVARARTGRWIGDPASAGGPTGWQETGFISGWGLLIADCRLFIVDCRFLSRSHAASASPNHQYQIINTKSSIPNHQYQIINPQSSIPNLLPPAHAGLAISSPAH